MDNENLTTTQQQAAVMITPLTGKQRVIATVTITADDGEEITATQAFDHKPVKEELTKLITDEINARTNRKIIEGLTWNGIPVWLSTENQLNFKAAYDLAVQAGGQNLPVTFKLGEDADGKAVYHTFATTEELSEFYLASVEHIHQCLEHGWQLKELAARQVDEWEQARNDKSISEEGEA